MSSYSYSPLWKKAMARLKDRQAEGWKDLALGLGMAVAPMAAPDMSAASPSAQGESADRLSRSPMDIVLYIAADMAGVDAEAIRSGHDMNALSAAAEWLDNTPRAEIHKLLQSLGVDKSRWTEAINRAGQFLENAIEAIEAGRANV